MKVFGFQLRSDDRLTSGTASIRLPTGFCLPFPTLFGFRRLLVELSRRQTPFGCDCVSSPLSRPISPHSNLRLEHVAAEHQYLQGLFLNYSPPEPSNTVWLVNTSRSLACFALKVPLCAQPTDFDPTVKPCPRSPGAPLAF